MRASLLHSFGIFILCSAPLSSALLTASGPSHSTFSEIIPTTESETAGFFFIGSSSLYYVGETPSTWDEAEADCSTRGINGHLASVGHYTERFILLRRLEGSLQIHSNLWIGMRRNQLGNFIMVSGASDNVLDWAEGKPSNVTGEDCVELLPESSTIVNNNCDVKRKYLCASDRAFNPDIASNTLYLVGNKAYTWDDAQAQCRSKGINGRLATIDSESEYKRLVDFIWMAFSPVWLGVRRDQSGVFGNNFTNWLVRKEHENLAKNGSCVAVFIKQLLISSCQDKKKYICAIDKPEGQSPPFSSLTRSITTTSDPAPPENIGTESTSLPSSLTSTTTTISDFSITKDFSLQQENQLPGDASYCRSTVIVSSVISVLVVAAVIAAIVIKRRPMSAPSTYSIQNQETNDRLKLTSSPQISHVSNQDL